MTGEQNDAWDAFYEAYNKQERRGGKRLMIPEKPYKVLLTQYYTRIRQKLKRLPPLSNSRQAVEQDLDLLKAIFMWRNEPDRELVVNKLDKYNQREYVDILWDEFENHTPDQMYDLVLEMFNDIEHQIGDYSND